MDINRNNYEAWLLDFMEGSLSAEQILHLRDFLLLNPDCAVGMDDSEPMILAKEEISFSGKSALRKELPNHSSLLSEVGFDLCSIAMMEGDLSEIQEQEFLQSLGEDDEKMKEWLLWKQIRLKKETIFFHRKKALKRRIWPRSRVIWLSVTSAAAAVLLFFALLSPEQDISSSPMLSLETDPEPAVEQASSHSSEIESASVLESDSKTESSQKPGVTASKTAMLSIIKHQDPPELTGQMKDNTKLIVKEADLQERPLRLAQLESGLVKPATQVSYDKIEPLEHPPLLDYSGQKVDPEYEEEGLRRSYRDFVEEKNISLLSIANAGVNGINQLAGSDLSLDVSKDEKGEVKRFRFKSSLLSIDSPVKKQNISR